MDDSLRRRGFVSLALLVLAACSSDERHDGTRSASTALAHSASLDPRLAHVLAGALPAAKFDVVVSYDAPSTGLAKLTSALEGLGLGVLQFPHLHAVAVRATAAQITGLRALAGVRSVYLNRPLKYLLNQSVPGTHADQVVATGVTGAGVGVAVLDSGIDGLRPDLAYPSHTVQNVKIVADVNDILAGIAPPTPVGALALENLPDTDTTTGHGTHCAGIIGGLGAQSGGKYKGVAPGAKLIGIGVGDGINILWTLAGFDWILGHKDQYNIRVVSNSWGSEGTYDENDPINQATKKVHDAGIAVTFAGGNSGPGANTINPYSVAPWVLGVAAGCKIDPNNDTPTCLRAGDKLVADFSSRGTPDSDLLHPDVTAPGVDIVSDRALTGTVLNVLDAQSDLTKCNIAAGDLLGYTCASGTSMATPHVAGIMALLVEATGGKITPDQAYESIVNTARPLAGYATFEAGAGYVDAKAAVDYAKSHFAQDASF
ncbi:S8 family serine peptidase [Pendulispora brunnea]|uniref:S8 family serine peptidase n=1 Tax=Pendulispora brunnea TaxID=2905690 RepID=A0ABZ2JWW0_9BACT